MNRMMNRVRWMPLLVLGVGIVLLGGCGMLKDLKEASPVVAVEEYQQALLGKLTSDYIGNENCLKGCHTHDKLALDFKSSTMGDQLARASSGMVIVDCESCHGPASELMEAIEGLKVEVPADKAVIVQAHEDNLLDYNTLSSGARSFVCLRCHAANATFNIHNWNAGVHPANNVSCSDCHPIHAGADLITSPREIQGLCLGCHIDVGVQFSLPSHHAVKQGKIYCTDCHNPHGTENPKQLREMTQKETCGRCHTEKTGPFLFEHGDITERCTNCHNQHGSVNDKLLKLPVTFLCKQCHPQHRNSSDALAAKSMSYTRCTDCHSMVHGTDTPGVSTNTGGGGAFTR